MCFRYCHVLVTLGIDVGHAGPTGCPDSGQSKRNARPHHVHNVLSTRCDIWLDVLSLGVISDCDREGVLHFLSICFQLFFSAKRKVGVRKNGKVMVPPALNASYVLEWIYGLWEKKGRALEHLVASHWGTLSSCSLLPSQPLSSDKAWQETQRCS